MLNSSERVRVLSRMFTRPVFTSLAKTGDWRAACDFLARYSLLRACSPQPLACLFENAWKIMKAEYRNEYVYKNEIADRVVFGLHSPKTAALHLELPVARSIVDVAVFNGTSTAYEIKTEFDSMRRLETQTASYCRAFEFVYVVTAPDFAEKYAQAVSPSVGVFALTRSGSLSKTKDAQSNKSYLNNEIMFRCMRREEYLPILAKHRPDLGMLPNGIIASESMEIFRKLRTDDAHQIYLAALQGRKVSGGIPKFVSSLPRCLRALGCGTPLSRVQQDRVISALENEVCFAIA